MSFIAAMALAAVLADGHRLRRLRLRSVAARLAGAGGRLDAMAAVRIAAAASIGPSSAIPAGCLNAASAAGRS